MATARNIPGPYQVADKARFTFDALKAFNGFFGRDPMRYAADAFRHSDGYSYTAREFIENAASHAPEAPYWVAALAAHDFIVAHPNAKQVVHALRRMAPRCYTEKMMQRAYAVEQLELACEKTRAAADNAACGWDEYDTATHKANARRALEIARKARLHGTFATYY